MAEQATAKKAATAEPKVAPTESKAEVKKKPFSSSTQARQSKYIFKLLEARRYKTLPTTNLVWDEETQRPRYIRLVNGVNTIWKDEQDDRKIDNALAERQAWRPEFNESFMILESPVDDLKIQYMMLLDGYDGKKNRITDRPPLFTWENKVTKSEDAYELKKKKREAMDAAFNLVESNIEEIYPHARYLGINFKDGYGEQKSEAAIANEYVTIAENNPELFLKSLNSPIVKVRHMIYQAVQDGFVDLNHMRGQAHWGESKAFITTMDMSKSTEDSLSDFAMSEDGVEFVKTLKLRYGK